MDTTLRPCPFCGASGDELFCDELFDVWAVRCLCCHIDGPFAKDEAENTREGAIKRWNTRSYDKPLARILYPVGFGKKPAHER